MSTEEVTVFLLTTISCDLFSAYFKFNDFQNVSQSLPVSSFDLELINAVVCLVAEPFDNTGILFLVDIF